MTNIKYLLYYKYVIGIIMAVTVVVLSSINTFAQSSNQIITSESLWINPASRISYLPSLESNILFGVQDLKISVEMSESIKTCEIRLRKYIEKDGWRQYPPTIQNKSCSVVFPKDDQTHWFWEGSVKIVDSLDRQWVRFIQPTFNRGALMHVTITARLVD